VHEAFKRIIKYVIMFVYAMGYVITLALFYLYLLGWEKELGEGDFILPARLVALFYLFLGLIPLLIFGALVKQLYAVWLSTLNCWRKFLVFLPI